MISELKQPCHRTDGHIENQMTIYVPYPSHATFRRLSVFVRGRRMVVQYTWFSVALRVKNKSFLFPAQPYSSARAPNSHFLPLPSCFPCTSPLHFSHLSYVLVSYFLLFLPAKFLVPFHFRPWKAWDEYMACGGYCRGSALLRCKSVALPVI